MLAGVNYSWSLCSSVEGRNGDNLRIYCTEETQGLSTYTHTPHRTAVALFPANATCSYKTITVAVCATGA